jgi:general secretion pathway protein J
MRTLPTSRGFTLLEVMMVILLLALLLAGAYSGITSAARSMRSGEAIIERIDKVRTVQEFLRHQLSRALPFPYNQPPGRNPALTQVQRDIFSGDSKFMRFVAPMPGYLSRGGAYVQTLQLVSGEDGLQLVFTSALLNGFDLDKGGAADPASTVVLLDHIRDGKFSYRGLDEQGQLTNWSDAWPDATSTPLMVNIDLNLVAGRVGWPALSIPLMMDASAKRNPGAAGMRR